MMEARQGFGEDICDLLSRENVGKNYELGIICVSNLMTIYFNMFSAFMMH